VNSGAEVRQPAYAWGQWVIAVDDLINDGSYPGRRENELLAARGALGEIVKIGHAPDLNEPVYLVEFDGCVLGCLEVELLAAPVGVRPVIGASA
jgi:nitrogen fixation protein NifZ